MSDLTRLTSDLNEFITRRVESGMNRLKSHPDYANSLRGMEQIESDVKSLVGEKDITGLMNKIIGNASDMASAHQEQAYIQGFKDAIVLMKEF